MSADPPPGGPPKPRETPRRSRLDAIGWCGALATAAWAACLHHGLGPPAAEPTAAWFEPSGFLLRVEPFAAAFESLPRALAAGVGPAGALAGIALVGSRSAAAGALSLICVVSAALFVFYGVAAPYPWAFFGWRGSLAMVGTAACVGAALASPMLAAAWLRLRTGARLAVYLPVALIVVALIRNTTGTDESLRYAISPWPAVPVFGIEVGALFVAASLLGVGVATHGLTAASPGRRIARVALGLLLPLLGVGVGAALSLFPFRLGPGTLLALVAVCGASVAITALTARGDAARLRRRARNRVLGAALVATPLLLGQGLARIDYHVTREWRARAIISALDAYAAREALYPDALEDLVAEGFLDAVPAPAIGFRLLSDTAFRYQSFGSSFILEFEAPRWVECAYTPPYEDDAAGGDEALAEAWSCPSEPPELW